MRSPVSASLNTSLIPVPRSSGAAWLTAEFPGPTAPKWYHGPIFLIQRRRSLKPQAERGVPPVDAFNPAHNAARAPLSYLT